MSPQKNFENKVFKDSRKIDLQHTSEAIRVLRKRGTSPPPFSKNREEFPPPPFRSWKWEIFYENAFFFMPKKHDFYLKNGHFFDLFWLWLWSFSLRNNRASPPLEGIRNNRAPGGSNIGITVVENLTIIKITKCHLVEQNIRQKQQFYRFPHLAQCSIQNRFQPWNVRRPPGRFLIIPSLAFRPKLCTNERRLTSKNSAWNWFKRYFCWK